MKLTSGGDRSPRSLTALLSLALALLVSGTLVTFSALGLRAGFAEPRRGTVAARDAGKLNRAPLVLPSTTPPPEPSQSEPEQGSAARSETRKSRATDVVVVDERLRRKNAKPSSGDKAPGDTARTSVRPTVSQVGGEEPKNRGKGHAYGHEKHRHEHGKAKGHEKHKHEHGKAKGHDKHH